MIAEEIQKQIIEAMKAKDQVRLATLKLLSASLHNAKIDKKEALNKEEELVIVKKEAKRRKDAIDLYKKVGASDKAENEAAELAVLSKFLPEEMSDSELAKIVGETIKEMGSPSPEEMGKVIGAVMGKVKGQADGKRVSELVKDNLSTKKDD